MYLVNRLLTAIGILFFIVIVTVTLAAPQIVVDLASRLDTTNTTQRVVQIAAAVVLDFLALLLLYRLLRPVPPDGLLVRTRGSKTEVSIDSVQRQINARMDEVSDVLSAQTEVLAERGNARITMHVRARPDIVIPEKQKEINRVLRQVVEKQLGLRLAGPPMVHVDLVSATPEMAEGPAPAARPSLPPPPTGMVEVEEERAPEPAPLPVEKEMSAPPAPEEDLEGATLPLREEAQPQTQEQGQEPEKPEKEEEPWRAFLLGDQDEDEDDASSS